MLTYFWEGTGNVPQKMLVFTSILRLVGPHKSDSKNNEDKNKVLSYDIICQIKVADILFSNEIQDIHKICANGNKGKIYFFNNQTCKL